MMILSKWRCQYLWPLWPVNLLCTKWDSHQDALNPLTGPPLQRPPFFQFAFVAEDPVAQISSSRANIGQLWFTSKEQHDWTWLIVKGIGLRFEPRGYVGKGPRFFLLLDWTSTGLFFFALHSPCFLVMRPDFHVQSYGKDCPYVPIIANFLHLFTQKLQSVTMWTNPQFLYYIISSYFFYSMILIFLMWVVNNAICTIPQSSPFL